MITDDDALPQAIIIMFFSLKNPFIVLIILADIFSPIPGFDFVSHSKGHVRWMGPNYLTPFSQFHSKKNKGKYLSHRTMSLSCLDMIKPYL